MNRIGTRLIAATVVASLLTLGGAVASVGYIDQTQIQVILSGPNVVRCNRAATISAKVVSTKNGKPVPNQVVNWSLAQSRSGGDGLSAGSTVTDKRGRTAVTLVFGPVAGSRTVSAGAATTRPSITVRCAGGLPKTAPRPPAGHEAPVSNALLIPDSATGIESTSSLPATEIRLDRLGIDLPLVEGDGLVGPEDAAAHYPGTAWPGEGSNTFIYAHAREGAFLDLWKVRTGDLVEVTMADGKVVEHRVSEIRPMVAFDDLDLLAATDKEIITLQTCLTYDDTAPRFVVIAERVDRV